MMARLERQPVLDQSIDAEMDKPREDAKVLPLKRLLICSSDREITARWCRLLERKDCERVIISAGHLNRTLDTAPAGIVLVDLFPFSPVERKNLPAVLCEKYPDVAFIFFSERPNEEEGMYLIANGGRGYCNRLIAGPLLNKVLEVVSLGEVWLGRKLLFHLMANLSNPPQKAADHQINQRLSELTTRERDIALRVGTGDSNKVIARDLDITERTVKAHISSIFRKTGTKDRLQLGLLINNHL